MRSPSTAFLLSSLSACLSLTAPALAGSFEDDCHYNFGLEYGSEKMEKCVAAYEAQDKKAKDALANADATQEEYLNAILREQRKANKGGAQSSDPTLCVFTGSLMVCP